MLEFFAFKVNHSVGVSNAFPVPIGLRRNIWLPLLLLLGILAGCATLFQRKEAEILVTANVDGAEVTVDGVNRGTVPLQIKVSNKDDHLIKVSKVGFSEYVCHLNSSVSALWVLLNVLFWPGLIVDAVTGNWNTLDESTCSAFLRPVSDTSQTLDATPASPPVEKEPAKVAKATEGAFVAVFDIQDKTGRLSPRDIDSLTEYVALKLAEGGLYHVIPRADLKNRLLEQKKESYRACYDEACQIEIGREMAAQKSLSLSLAAVGNSCLVSAALYDLKKAATDITAASRGGCSLEELVNQLDEVVNRLRQQAR